MISDVLSDAIASIRAYQRNFPDCYDDIKSEIDSVVSVMDGLRQKVDTPPMPDERRTT
jgi:hypothetical protein